MCQFCGNPANAVCHLTHRGMGGDDRKNTDANCISLCTTHHNQLDHRQRPWLRIVKFEPDNKEDGLIVQQYLPSDDAWISLNRHLLYFYQ